MSYLDDLSDIWEQIKESLAEQFPPSQMDLWFRPLEIHSYDNNVIVFSTNSEFKYTKVKEKYLSVIKDAFTDFFGFEQEVDIIFTGEPTTPEKIRRQLGLDRVNLPPKKEAAPTEPSVDAEVKNDTSAAVTGVLPIDYSFQYTFDNFIVGSSNKFAHAACTAVAAHPASNYNPLFIYGPSGLGKTHLMSAIVNEMKRKNPAAKVIYIKGDDFTNEMIESLSKQEMHKFHAKYRNCDILLIDDIQFIAGKTSTQEEFFHTFNTLYEDRKQIVMSSDRPPKDIQTLEDRLKTRFEWGLIADIQPPDLELRIAIIKKKAEQVSINLSDEVLTFLAENLRSNIRQIEGTIKKLSAIVFLSGRTITMEIAASCLQEITGGVVPVQVTVDKIFSAVYGKYNVGKEDQIGRA
ncbi:MAG: chromosomal replication initiator protein DnaA, partial [Clostridia bacterium]|nr:chromosomal replication initiator protein DnaA [Clostridia bacterium]